MRGGRQHEETMAAVMKENPNITRFIKEQRFSIREAEPEAKREGARPRKVQCGVTSEAPISSELIS
jgi:hypothetical protein